MALTSGKIPLFVLIGGEKVKEALLSKIQELCEKPLSNIGISIYHLEFVNENGDDFLRFYIDKAYCSMKPALFWIPASAGMTCIMYYRMTQIRSSCRSLF
jgi:hypothetical protein